jgi:hypothetical protein
LVKDEEEKSQGQREETAAVQGLIMVMGLEAR